MKTLKNWKIVTVNDLQCVSGEIYGHPHFKDGTRITTSSLKGFGKDVSGKSLLITAKGTVYQLEEEAYEDQNKQYRSVSSESDYESNLIDESVNYLVQGGFLHDPSKGLAKEDEGDL